MTGETIIRCAEDTRKHKHDFIDKSTFWEVVVSYAHALNAESHAMFASSYFSDVVGASTLYREAGKHYAHASKQISESKETSGAEGRRNLEWAREIQAKAEECFSRNPGDSLRNLARE